MTNFTKSTCASIWKRILSAILLPEAARINGYFTPFSKEVNNPFEALSLYQSKDNVEKEFDKIFAAK
jgi:transposase